MRQPRTTDREALQGLIDTIGLQGVLISLAEECKIRSEAAGEAAGDGPLSEDEEDWADAWTAVCKARDYVIAAIL